MIRNLLPGILWGIVILILSGIPGNYVPSVFGFLDWISPDKLIHLIMYLVFVFVLLRGMRKYQNTKEVSRRVIYSILGTGIVLGGVTEILQNIVFIRRNGNVYDFIADIIGCLIGLIVYLVYQRKKNKESSV